MEQIDWRKAKISSDQTHHTIDDSPIYGERYSEVLKFHEPGLAPVKLYDQAFHIDITGKSVYSECYLRTFGFYQHRAAVWSKIGWFHILPNGNALYPEKYSWVGNYQNDRCPVKDNNGLYSHIDLEGRLVYEARYLYTGDFKDDIAVVRELSGKCTHIDNKGNFIHNNRFLDLDIYHKGFALSRDQKGWFHIKISGEEAYSNRFLQLEPFYNGFSLGSTFDGSKVIINENGEIIQVIYSAGNEK